MYDVLHPLLAYDAEDDISYSLCMTTPIHDIVDIRITTNICNITLYV